MEFFERVGNGRVKCTLCVRECVLEPGQRGACRVRVNRQGEIHSLIYGRLSTYSVEYVEKIPLYLYYPNSQFITLGSAGCNLGCDFCLTWNITQVEPEEVDLSPLSPDNIVKSARALRARGIAYTHSEPTLNIEYYLEVMKTAVRSGLKNVFATNGIISLEALHTILNHVDAFAVTFKGSRKFYSRACHFSPPEGHLSRVLRSIRDAGKHLELVYVLIPGKNDDTQSLKELAALASEVEAPVILLRFFPSYRYERVESTPEESLERARDYLIGAGVGHVFLENIFSHPGKNVYCRECGKVLVSRQGYGVVEWNLRTEGEENYCIFCGSKSQVLGTLGKLL